MTGGGGAGVSAHTRNLTSAGGRAADTSVGWALTVYPEPVKLVARSGTEESGRSPLPAVSLIRIAPRRKRRGGPAASYADTARRIG